MLISAWTEDPGRDRRRRRAGRTGRSARSAMPQPGVRRARRTAPSTASVPISPSSSPMIAKMKSVCASGRPPHFSRLAPRPTPHQPPRAERVLAVQRLEPVVERVGLVGCSQTVIRRHPVRTGCRPGRSRPAAAGTEQRRTAAAVRPATQSSAARIDGDQDHRGAQVVRRAGPGRGSDRRPAASGHEQVLPLRRAACSLRASRSAPHRTSASLADSDGCSRNGPPKSSQFWLPLTLDVPATTTSTSSASEPTSAGVGEPSARRGPAAATRPHQRQPDHRPTCACLLTIANDEPSERRTPRRWTRRAP